VDSTNHLPLDGGGPANLRENWFGHGMRSRSCNASALSKTARACCDFSLVVANTINAAADIQAIAAGINLLAPISVTVLIAPIAIIILFVQV
jgi:hypothetical protein